MKVYFSQLLVAFWLVSQIGALALDPTEVNGSVTVDVDRSKPVWTVTVTNQSAENLSYEMLDKAPRGLGMEVWDRDRQTVTVIIVHAYNLAASLNIDGFPQDIREIAPGKSEKFLLDPKSMSTTDDINHARWERAKRIGYYDCRVFFGVYASRMISVFPEDKPEKQGASEKAEPALFSDVIKESKEEDLSGIALRRMLNEEKRALVHWHRGTDGKDDYYIKYTTCAKADFDKMAPWDGSKPPELAMHELIARAREIARENNDDFQTTDLVALVIEPTEDDSSKYYTYITLENDDDDTTIELLLNGAHMKTTKLRVTNQQYDEFSEYGIPKLRE